MLQNLKNTKDRKHLLFDAILIPIVSVFFALILLISIPNNFKLNVNNVWVFLTFIINFLVFLGGLFYSVKVYNFSLLAIFYIFNIFFFFLAPFIQFCNSQFPLNANISNKELIISNLLILFFVIVVQIMYIFGCKFLKNKHKIDEKKYQFDIQNGKYVNLFLWTASIICCLFSAGLIIEIGFKNVFIRAEMECAFAWLKNKTIIYMFSVLIKYFTAVVFILNFLQTRKYKTHYTKLALSLLALLILAFPTSLPRYIMATIYGGIALVLFNKFLKNNRLVVYGFIVLMIVVFPLLRFSRYESIFSLDFFHNVGLFLQNFKLCFLSGDYDAYINIVRCINYVEIYGLTYGYQLLGVILFFIPRVFWNTKPIGTGAMIATNLNESFTNISMPFVAEAFANFGILGIILFALLLGVVCVYLDFRYWKESFMEISYPFVMFLLFFMLRGDLMSSFSSLCAFLATTLVTLMIIKLLQNIDRKQTPSENKI